MPVVNKNCVDVFDSGQGELVYELTGAACDNNESYSVAHVELLPGAASQRHYHPVVEECYYIIKGQGEIQLGDKLVTLKTLDCVRIPPGIWHQIYNTGEGLLEFIVFCQPAWTVDCSVYESNSRKDTVK